MIYISGPITNNPDYENQFNFAEKFLKSKGYKVLNPIKHERTGKSWSYYLRKDIKKLLKCNAIYLLNGWQYSKGANLELAIARAMNYQIIFEGDL